MAFDKQLIGYEPASKTQQKANDIGEFITNDIFFPRKRDANGLLIFRLWSVWYDLIIN